MDAVQPVKADDAGASPEAGRITPMMEQYIEIKAANPDCLLFYRMGDFYELFFDDAEIASRALGIVLTKRGKHLGRDIPMCGVPIERADEYLHRLIALGHRVAVCEQLEDPAEARKRGAKSVVRRDVVRLVTPGTLTEDSLLDARSNNYLLALARARARPAATSSSRSPGSTYRPANSASRECERTTLAAEIARARAGRDHRFRRALFRCRNWRRICVRCRRSRRCRATCSTARPPSGGSRRSSPSQLQPRSGRSRACELTAAAAAITYVERTQIGKRPPLSPPVAERAGATLAIDQATRSNLELHADVVRRAARVRCSPPSTAPSPRPARGFWRNVSPRRSPTRARSAIGSMRSRPSCATERCATTCASG